VGAISGPGHKRGRVSAFASVELHAQSNTVRTINPFSQLRQTTAATLCAAWAGPGGPVMEGGHTRDSGETMAGGRDGVIVHDTSNQYQVLAPRIAADRQGSGWTCAEVSSFLHLLSPRASTWTGQSRC